MSKIVFSPWTVHDYSLSFSQSVSSALPRIINGGCSLRHSHEDCHGRSGLVKSSVILSLSSLSLCCLCNSWTVSLSLSPAHTLNEQRVVRNGANAATVPRSVGARPRHIGRKERPLLQHNLSSRLVTGRQLAAAVLLFCALKRFRDGGLSSGPLR